MIFLLDTSTPECRMSFIEADGKRIDDIWQADRALARNLLGKIDADLKQQNKSWHDISGIGVFAGPGSFTGLRIGLTVMNTIVDSGQIPIIGAIGDDWQESALGRLSKGENDKLVMPLYGSEPHITTARK